MTAEIKGSEADVADGEFLGRCRGKSLSVWRRGARRIEATWILAYLDVR